MSMNDIKINEIIENHDQTMLEDYLRGRCINYVSPHMFYVKKPIYYNNHPYSGLFVVIRDYFGIVSSIIVRNNSGWSYAYKDKNTIPIYGIEKIKSSDNIIVTESVLDADSINQFEINNVYAVSFLSSSFSMFQFHWLHYLAYDKTIITAFDNDSSGENSTNRFFTLSKYRYGKKIHKLSFGEKDVNEYICNSKMGVAILKNNIKEVIKGMS